jgi:hypothetical protein
MSAARRDPDLAVVLTDEMGGNEERFVALLRMAQSQGNAGFRASPEVIARFSLMLNLGSLVVDALGLPAVDEDEWRVFMNDLVHGFRPAPRDGSRERQGEGGA